MPEIQPMRRLFWSILLLWIGLAAFPSPAGAEPLRLSPTMAGLPAKPHVFLLEDPERALTLDQVRDPALASRFFPIAEGETHRGGSRSAWWVRLEAFNPGSRPQRWMLMVNHLFMDFVDGYHFPNAAAPPQRWQLGDHRAFTDRPVPSEYSIFPLETPAGGTSTVYLRLAYQDWGLMETALRVWTPEQLVRHQETQWLFHGLYFGGLGFMFLYNLFVFLSTRRADYFWYILYLLVYTGATFFWHGLGYRIFPEASPELRDLTPILLLGLVYPLGLQFGRVFLDLRDVPSIDRLFRIVMGLCLLTLPLLLLGFRSLGIQLLLLLTAIAALLPMLTSLWMWSRGKMRARLFSLGFLCLCAGMLLSLGRTTGTAPDALIIHWGGRIGFWLQAAFLSLALVDQVNRLRRERDEATRREQEAMQRVKIELETAVAARTRDLHQALREADKANQAKSLFLATMSHEIRTPLHGILGMAELLEETPLSEEGRGYARTLLGSGRSLLAIINDLLDFSKIEAGRLELERADFDLHRLLREISELFQGLARRKNLHFDLEMTEDVPEWVSGDAARLRQILANLLSNAIKFTAQGGVTLSAATLPGGGREGEISFRFEVRDTGIGIAPENFSRLFRLFEQMESSTTRRFGGTGLGLAICLRLVELARGEIEVESEPGQGALFRVTLPMTPATAPCPETVEPAPPALTQEAHVLIADDDEVNRAVLQGMLRRFPVVLHQASNGLEALAMLRRQPFDLVFLDDRMPGMDGLEVCRLFRQEETTRRTPLIAITGNAAREDRERCLAAGMDDFLSKPVARTEIHAALRRWLRSVKKDSAPLGEAAPSAPLLEESALTRLLNDIGSDGAALFTLLRESYPARLAAMRAAIRDHHPAVWMREAHTLKSNFRLIGAHVAADLAHQLELRAPVSSREEARELLTRLEANLSQLDHTLIPLIQLLTCRAHRGEAVFFFLLRRIDAILERLFVLLSSPSGENFPERSALAWELAQLSAENGFTTLEQPAVRLASDQADDAERFDELRETVFHFRHLTRSLRGSSNA
ncbi:MAG: response regulator [Magnetococcales bacterium]|nr:response regulator [Magnetococcales bacterium]